jgi:hypothetical protein
VEHNINVDWMNESIEKFPGSQGLYKLFCIILLKRRLTYSNLYVITHALHKRKYKDNELELKERIIKELAYIYYYNNGKLPNGFEFNTIKR